MKDAIRARLADAVDTLSDLDALLDTAGDRLPPLVLAQSLVRLESIGRRLARLRQAVDNAIADAQLAATRKTRQTPP